MRLLTQAYSDSVKLKSAVMAREYRLYKAFIGPLKRQALKNMMLKRLLLQFECPRRTMQAIFNQVGLNAKHRKQARSLKKWGDHPDTANLRTKMVVTDSQAVIKFAQFKQRQVVKVLSVRARNSKRLGEIHDKVVAAHVQAT